VGEIRDKETVDAALSASETGHLVLATLHTPNAKQSVERITGFYEGEEKGWVLNVLSSVLIGVMSQVLVRRNGGGRRLACEVLVNTDAVAQMIRENKVAQLQNLIITGKNAGMITLNAVLADMARKNEISMQEALYAAYDIAELRKDLGLAHG
ncbi:MAG TPA: twitching motility protein PilT, partial [Betaproteobacteria bacterium]|nr:twitching motility protein PilT [Betaproteobacteria bacterium]